MDLRAWYKDAIATDGPKSLRSTSKVYWLLTNQTITLIIVHVK